MIRGKFIVDRQRALFYGFIIGLVLLFAPIPGVFYLMDDNEAVFRYLGLVICVTCAIPLIIDVIEVFKNIFKEER
jgi:predicted tellurium resistance membrane protein TerC